jgi:hypothetical protein
MIDSLGQEALPHQTTTFPIQMNEWQSDHLLAIDEHNCPKLGKIYA